MKRNRKISDISPEEDIVVLQPISKSSQNRKNQRTDPSLTQVKSSTMRGKILSRMKSSKESKTEPLLPPPPPPMDPSTTSNDSDKAWVISSDEEGKPVAPRRKKRSIHSTSTSTSTLSIPSSTVDFESSQVLTTPSTLSSVSHHMRLKRSSTRLATASRSLSSLYTKQTSQSSIPPDHSQSSAKNLSSSGSLSAYKLWRNMTSPVAPPRQSRRQHSPPPFTNTRRRPDYYDLTASREFKPSYHHSQHEHDLEQRQSSPSWSPPMKSLGSTTPPPITRSDTSQTIKKMDRLQTKQQLRSSIIRFPDFDNDDDHIGTDRGPSLDNNDMDLSRQSIGIDIDQHIDNDDPFSLTDRNSNIIDGDISTSTQDINWDNDKISSSPEQEMNTYYDAAKTNNISNHSDNGHEFEYRMENDFDGGDLDNEAINLRASNKSSVDDWDEHDIDGIEYYLHKIDNNNIDSTSSTIKQHLDTHINSDDNSSNLDIPKDDFYILGDTDKVIRDEHLDKYSNMTGDDNNVDDKTNLHSDKENELDHDLKLGGDDQQTDIDEISNNAPIDKPNVNKGSDISNIIDTADIDKELDMDDNNNAPSIDYATDRSLALDNMNIVDTHDSNTNGTTDSKDTTIDTNHDHSNKNETDPIDLSSSSTTVPKFDIEALKIPPKRSIRHTKFLSTTSSLTSLHRFQENKRSGSDNDTTKKKMKTYSYPPRTLGLRSSSRLRGKARSSSGVDVSTPVELSDDEMEVSNDTVLFTYPLNRCKGSITITKKDQKRLAPSQYLNDSVIDFYLKWLMDSYSGENGHDDSSTWERKAIAETTHIFSTLFYNRLTQGMGQPIAYENVRKWTTNTDLFDKKYAVFPINEKLHWYLVIVCNLDRCIPNQTKDATDSDIWNMPSDSKSNDASNRPTIFILDSLGGRQRKCVNDLTRYMEMEAFTRRHVEKIDFVTPKFRYAHVPMQDNTCDCGVYLLHFVDLFLNSPQEFVETLLNNDTDNLIWQEDKIKEKRKELEGLFKRVHKQYTDTYGTDPVM